MGDRLRARKPPRYVLRRSVISCELASGAAWRGRGQRQRRSPARVGVYSGRSDLDPRLRAVLFQLDDARKESEERALLESVAFAGPDHHHLFDDHVWLAWTLELDCVHLHCRGDAGCCCHHCGNLLAGKATLELDRVQR